MALKGPAPVSEALRRLRGTSRGRRSLELTAGRPSRPRWLSREAAAEWRRVVPLLEDAGVLTELDGGVLAGFCECLADLRRTSAIIERDGYSFTTESGYSAPRPEVAIRKAALAQLRQYAAHLGLSPASRTRVEVVPPPAEFDPAEQFFNDVPARGRRR